MTYLSALPSDAALLQVFQAYPEAARPLLDLHEVVMRGPSPLSFAERELIAAYVSGLNQCSYCHGVHTATAESFGIPAGRVRAMLADLDSAGVPERLLPLLRYAGKLTRAPAQMTEADAESIFAAGWDDAALHATVSVCGLFNLMNRMVDGLGVRAGEDYFATSGQRLHDLGYAGLVTLLPASSDQVGRACPASDQRIRSGHARL